MILQEKIQKKAERFGKLASAFLEGANFALENQWINVKDDLPCYHKELIDPRESLLQTVLVIIWDGFSAKMDYMYYENKEWKWCHNKLVIYRFPIPKLPKEQE